MNQLKTREECKEIVNTSDAFYVTETEIQGFKAELYDYRLASFTDFYPNGLTGSNNLELRGLTFIYNPDTDTWERHLALKKFFNLNQCPGVIYEDVIKEEIIGIADKRDGSMITFVKLPNSKVVAKTKMSFTSPQAIMAQKIYENDSNVKNFIDDNIDKYTLVFELTSPHNQIVLSYNNTELYLLQMRDTNGFLTDIKNIAESSFIDVTEQYSLNDYDLDKLIDLKGKLENIEGWVITTNSKQYKIKTDWYMQLHGLISENIRENLLIKTILDNNIDDVIAQLQDGEKKTFIINVEMEVSKKFNQLVKEFKILRKKYSEEFKEDRKQFAIANSKHVLFGNIMKSLNIKKNEEDLAEEQVKLHILNKTKNLKEAKEWLTS